MTAALPPDELTERLSALCTEIETELKPHLRGFGAIVIRKYLPQAWSFQTEAGAAILRVDAGGNASVCREFGGPVDVIIKLSQSQLVEVLRSRVASGSPPRVIFQTSKGEAAFNFLRSRFGL